MYYNFHYKITALYCSFIYCNEQTSEERVRPFKVRYTCTHTNIQMHLGLRAWPLSLVEIFRSRLASWCSTPNQSFSLEAKLFKSASLQTTQTQFLLRGFMNTFLLFLPSMSLMWPYLGNDNPISGGKTR